jgi:hypothetical protein
LVVHWRIGTLIDCTEEKGMKAAVAYCRYSTELQKQTLD